MNTLWGISPKSRGEGATVWWGARAIYDQMSCSFGLLWDRKQTVGENAEPLWKWLDEWGLPALRKALSDNLVRSNDEEDIVVDSHGFKLIANPNRSYGYLYIGAWPMGEMVMPPDPPKARRDQRPKPPRTRPRKKVVR